MHVIGYHQYKPLDEIWYLHLEEKHGDRVHIIDILPIHYLHSKLKGIQLSVLIHKVTLI